MRCAWRSAGSAGRVEPDPTDEPLHDFVRDSDFEGLILDAEHTLMIHDFVAHDNPVDEIGAQPRQIEALLAVELAQGRLAAHRGFGLRRTEHFDVIGIDLEVAVQVVGVISIELVLDNGFGSC